jgi:glycosyltransferase involved in cell wall biosynthesis
VDEIVAALEYAYDHREQVRQIGRRSREWLIERERTWQAHARELKSWILSL